MLHNVTNNQAPSEDLQYTVKMSWSTLRKQHCDTNKTAKLITHEFTSMSNLNLLTLQVKNRKCIGCDKFIDKKNSLPIIENTNANVLTEETAYQMSSILRGAVQRGTAKKLKTLNVPLAGKTGTTNNNYDAWFIGFSSDLVIGVYIGFDNPKTLGKYETGSKAALPVFKYFVENALFKEDFKDFKIPDNIFMTSLNYDTGLKSESEDKNVIIEALKTKDINNINNNNLISVNDRDTLIKFRQFY